jgi:hypothetical protein
LLDYDDDYHHLTMTTIIILANLDCWPLRGNSLARQPSAPRLARAGIHYGWVIIAVTFVVSLTTAGAMGLPGALILPLSKEFGWDVA